MSKLSELTMEEALLMEWQFIGKTLREAQAKLEAGGTRHSWLDAAISIAAERGRGN